MPETDRSRIEAERHRAGVVVRERDELLRVLAEHIKEFIDIRDLDGRSVYASPSVERFHGRVPATLFELAHPEDIEDARTWWQQVLDGGTKRLDWRIRVNEDWRWLETSAALVPYLGRPHVLTISRDVTERKQAEAVRKTNEERLRLAFEAARIGTGEMDLRTQTIRLSEPMQRVVGLAPGTSTLSFEDWVGRVIHPEDRASVQQAVERGIAGDPHITLDYRIVWPDGTIRWVTSRATVLYDAEGHATRIIGAIMDITDRKRAEETLAAREAEFRNLAKSSPGIMGVFRLRADGTTCIPYTSPRIWDLYGLRPEDVVSDAEPLLTRTHPDDDAGLRESIFESARSMKPWRLEYRVLHPTRGEIWLEGYSNPFSHPDGGVIWYGFIREITERKRLEDQLRQAQKMEAVGHLAGGVAHDFNNLLTIISGSSEMLLQRLPPGDLLRDLVSEIRQASNRAAELTQQLLAFSRRTVLAPKLLDLNESVRDSESLLRRLIGEDVELKTVLAPELDAVKVDPVQLGQVIMNLAVNARDAMPTGGRLTIETRGSELDETASVKTIDAMPGRYVVLRVSDTGIGMTPEVQVHLFEPFFTTKESGKGTGLGLAMVYGVVKQSGGFICVDSQPDRGTIFEIHFPAAEGRLLEKKPTPVHKPTATGTETILLVEDEDAVRTIVSSVLQHAGYTVLEASRGRAAIDMVSAYAEPIHLLITDVVMPGMGGRQLVEHLLATRPSLKVLYLSGHTDDALIRHGVLEADVAFLQKPFKIAALTTKVREVLAADE